MSRESNEMASISQISHLFPIKDADRIEKAVVNKSWPVVVKKGAYQVGDIVVFCELDSFIPTVLDPTLTKPGHEPKIYNGVQGERLKAVRLKKTPSQGLVLPLSVLPTIASDEDWEKGDLVGDILGIQKWEAPQSFNAGLAKGNFPSEYRKSDQSRIQNVYDEVFGDPDMMNAKMEWTTKLDGSSMTVCLDDERGFVICSRNVWLKDDDNTSAFVRQAKAVFGENGELLEKYKNLQFMGELISTNIQSNFENVAAPEYRIFDIYDIANRKFLTPDQRHSVCRDLNITHVPVLTIASMNELGLTDLDKVLAFADGPSLYTDFREGIVAKRMDGEFSYKAVCTRYLEDKRT